MEVRVCPSCGTENKRSRSSCANCYASLASVPATQSGAGAKPTAPQGRTLSSAPMQGARAQSNPQTPPAGAPAPGYSSPQPESRGSLAWLFILVGVLLAIGAVAFVGLQLRPFVKAASAEPKVPADKVITDFLEAKKTHDYAKVKPFLSEASITAIDATFSGRQMQSAGFTREDAYNTHLWDVSPTPRQLGMSDYAVKPIANEEAAKEGMRVIRVSLTPKQSARESEDMSDMSQMASMAPEVDFYLVNEKAEWKIDLKETTRHASERPLVFPK